MIEKAFINWWRSTKPSDVMAVNSLASSEAWYQFEFGKFLQKHFWKQKDWASELYLEKDKVDIIVNGIQIECKMIWNNKNIWNAVVSIIKDGKSVRSSRKGGYLALFMAFSNKHFNSGLLPPSYTNTCHGLALQTANKSDDFIEFSKGIWKLIRHEIRTRLKLKYNPKLIQKYKSKDSWCAAVLWKVK
jgi:hypothetical protein